MPSVFFNPWMLAALAAVAIPLIIEWLFRRRKRQVELPTLRYLLDNREQEKIRRQDRILLILRTVAIFLLVMALARPLIQRGWLKQGRQREVVLLLDATASMNQQVDVSTAFGEAKKKAASIIDGLPRDARVTVITLGDRVFQPVPFTGDLPTAAATVKSLGAGSGAAPMNEGFAFVKQLLADNRIEQAELYVFSDFQRQTWQPSNRQEQVARALGELGDTCETFMVDVGGQPKFNYLVTDLRPAETVISAGRTVRFDVVVAARGEVPDNELAEIAFLVDQTQVDAQKARATETSPAHLSFDYRFPGPGEYLIEVVVKGDAHGVDNRRMYLCSVPDSVAVLVLDDLAGSDAANSFFLARAIAPPVHPGMEKVSYFSTTVISPAEIVFQNLDDYALVVLTASRLIDESIVSKLERYVSDGGALWAFTGPAVNLYDYNRLLYRDGQGLLPCALGAVVNATTQPDERGLGGAEPMFSQSPSPGLADLNDQPANPDAIVLQYHRLERPTPAAQEVLALSNRDPLMMEQPYGRGRVLLCGTTADAEWNYLAGPYEFAVLCHGMMKHLVGDRDRAVNLQVGDVFTETVRMERRQVRLRYPDNQEEMVDPQPIPGRDDTLLVRVEKTGQEGLYSFIQEKNEVLPLARRRFVVNQSEREGDLSRLNEGDFKDAFNASQWSWVRPQVSIGDMAARLHTVIELFPALLWGLVGLLAAESFLAWRFGRRRGEGTA